MQSEDTRDEDLGGFDPDAQYEEFPPGAKYGYGPRQGFNEWVRLNDPDLFTEAARQHPVIAAFLAAPFTVTYAQFKSSTRESEYFLHKPVRAMTDGVEGIEGGVVNMPQAARIATLVINHERTLAKRITRSIVIEDGEAAGQILHKQEAE